jgi:hypothetical protein
MRFSGTITAVVGAMLVGATTANNPSPSPNGPSPNGPGPGPELSSLEERSSSSPGPSPDHSFSGPAGPKVFASGPSPGPFSPGPVSPGSDHTLEVRSDASSPFSPSPAGPGPKIVASGPSPDSDHTLEVRSDDYSPSPAGAGPEGPHPNPSDHTLEVRSDSPLLDPTQAPDHPYFKENFGKAKNNGKAEKDPYVKSPEQFSKDIFDERVINALAEVQDLREIEFQTIAVGHDKDAHARVDAWKALSQQERDNRDMASARERVAAQDAERKKTADERIALLDRKRKDSEAAKAKKQAELDQMVKEMHEDTKARMAKKPGPGQTGKAVAPDLDQASLEKLAQDKLDADKHKREDDPKLVQEKELAEKLAADKAAAEKEKKEAEAKLKIENEEANKAEQAAADKLAEDKAAAKIEKEKVDQKLAQEKAGEADAVKLAGEKEDARLEKEKIDQKLAEEKKVVEEEKKAAADKISEDKKETKQEEKDAAKKLKEEKAAIEKEEKEAEEKEKKAENPKNHISKADHGVSRIAKPKGCSCFEAFSHILGYETKTSGPLDKFRLDIWAVRNRKCIQYCTHPFSKSEFDSYSATVKDKLNLPGNFPDRFHIEAGSESSGAHEKREELGSGPGPNYKTIYDRFEMVKDDIKDLQESQKATDDVLGMGPPTDEPKKVKPNPFTKSVESTLESTLEAESKAVRKPEVKLAVKPAVKTVVKPVSKAVTKPITDPKVANAELHAAYNLWLLEFKNSVKGQRAALNGDRKAIKQLNNQLVKTLEEAEKSFVKASEEAAAAAAVDMRKEAFKEFKNVDDKKKAETKKTFFGVKDLAEHMGVPKEKDLTMDKAPLHLDNANTVIPPA